MKGHLLFARHKPEQDGSLVVTGRRDRAIDPSHRGVGVNGLPNEIHCNLIRQLAKRIVRSLD